MPPRRLPRTAVLGIPGHRRKIFGPSGPERNPDRLLSRRHVRDDVGSLGWGHRASVSGLPFRRIHRPIRCQTARAKTPSPATPPPIAAMTKEMEPPSRYANAGYKPQTLLRISLGGGRTGSRSFRIWLRAWQRYLMKQRCSLVRHVATRLRPR